MCLLSGTGTLQMMSWAFAATSESEGLGLHFLHYYLLCLNLCNGLGLSLKMAAGFFLLAEEY